MEYTITFLDINKKPFIKLEKRIDKAIDDYWYFVEDCPNFDVHFFKNKVDITDKIKNNLVLRDKYYKGLDGCRKPGDA